MGRSVKNRTCWHRVNNCIIAICWHSVKRFAFFFLIRILFPHDPHSFSSWIAFRSPPDRIFSLLKWTINAFRSVLWALSPPNQMRKQIQYRQSGKFTKSVVTTFGEDMIMMKMKKKICLLLVLCLACTLFNACGTQTTQTAQSQGGVNNTEQETKTETGLFSGKTRPAWTRSILTGTAFIKMTRKSVLIRSLMKRSSYLQKTGNSWFLIAYPGKKLSWERANISARTRWRKDFRAIGPARL